MGAQAMQGAVAAMIRNWLVDRPILNWGLAHPVWTLVGLAVLVLLSGGLLRAIAQLTEQLWIRLLQLPMRLGQWILAQLLQLFGRPFRALLPAEPEPIDSPSAELNIAHLQDVHASSEAEQLYEILARLEQIQQAQTLLLQDIKQLLLNQASSPSGRKKQIVSPIELVR
jgi:hypothetical protein